ncbi:MAG: hypothetical protein WCR63_00625 [Bacilli bacterium]
MNNYLKFPLVLGGVCLVCGSALAGVNYLTEDTIAQHIIDAKQQAIFDILEENNLSLAGDSSTIVEIPWESEHASTLDTRKLVPCTDSDYYYYQATTETGYSGSITFGALVDLNYDIVGYEFITSDEDDIGTNASKQITISLENPYSGGDLVAGETIASGASAKVTLPVVESALEDIINDAKTISGTGEVDTNETLTAILEANGLNIKFGEEATDIEWEGDHAETLNSRQLIPCTDADYYYYEATTETGYSGTITFGALANEDADVVGFEYISGTEDSLGKKAVKKITISIENPYSGGELVAGDTIEAGASADHTLPVVESALEDIISDVKSLVDDNKYLTAILAANNLELKDGAEVTEIEWEGEHAETLNYRQLVPCTDADYYYYEVTTEQGFSGTITFGALVNSDADVVGFIYISGTEDQIGKTAVKQITISVDNPYSGGELVAGETIETGASAHVTLPVVESALEAVIADAELIIGGIN